MKEFGLSRQYLGTVKEYSKSICALTELGAKYRFFLGITGSAISSNPEKGRDVDLLIVLAAEHFESEDFELPEDFNKESWQLRLSNQTKPDVVGSFNVKNPAIRLEVCNVQSMLKLLKQEHFIINRVKEIPKKDKIEIFINDKGKTISKVLEIQGLLSDTVSIIENKGSIYWGMHFERVLLAEKIFDNLSFFQEIVNCRKKFLENIDKSSKLEQLFYCSRNNNKINILSHLISY